MKIRTSSGLLLQLGLLVFLTGRLSAAYYNWQEYDGNQLGGPVGQATLQLSNNTSTIRANFIKGSGSFVNNLVIYVDTKPGGFTDTSRFTNTANALEIAVSGYEVSRSVATFAPGFAADYAIALGVNSGSAVYRLVDDATGPRMELVHNGLNFVVIDSPNHPSYSFQFDWADIGLPSGNTNFFKFESTYLTSHGYRYLDSFEGVTGKIAFDYVTFTNYDTYGVEPIPENANAALAIFGGIVMSAVLIKRARYRTTIAQSFGPTTDGHQ